jgi:hypothetical protein
MRTIRLESDPKGAEIFLDGKNTGKRTPDSLSLASNSTGNVELRMKGYEPSRVAINDSSPESIKSILKQLVQELGSITYDNPGKVQIFDGKTLLMDTSTAKSFQLKPGRYTLTIESGGGILLKHTEKVEVKSGGDTKIRFSPGCIMLPSHGHHSMLTMKSRSPSRTTKKQLCVVL